MNMSKREKYIAIAAGAVVLLWLADAVVLTPAWSAYNGDLDQAQALQQELFDAERLLREAGRIESEHERRIEAGLGLGPSQAQGQMVESIERWVADAGLANRSTLPERSDTADGLHIIRCRVTGEGRMSTLVRLCWLMETSEIPLRIGQMRVSSSDATQDKLSIQLHVSTACLDRSAEVGRARGQGGRR
jgi:hypothetical protein